MIKYIFRFVPLLLSTLFAFFSVFSSSLNNLEKDIALQKERIASLEQLYIQGEVEPIDETVFFNGDLDAEIENGMKFNELRYIATHNSYQTETSAEMRKIYKNLSSLTFGLVNGALGDFVSPTITEQLNNGIYSLELDVETFDRNGEVTFTCMHSPYFEMGTSCYDFALALKEISLWSDNNPDHLPITIIIEMKQSFLPVKDMKFPNINYIRKFDETLRENLGDKLFTPDDMLRDYSDFAQLRAENGWCEVKDMLGKVLVLFHECKQTQEYVDIDPSLRTQAMFPMMRYADINNPDASFLLMNNPLEDDKAMYEEVLNANFIVRTRADKFTEVTPERRQLAFESGAQIISTDFPVKYGLKDGDYFVSFDGFKTISTR